MSYSTIALPQTETRYRSLFQQVYLWMSVGLALTGFVAWWAYTSGTIERILSGGQLLFFGLIAAELGLVIGLNWGISRMSAGLATAGFVLYSALSGLTLSVIFLVYTADSIASTFFVTAGTFAAMSLYGYTTKRDLTTVGNMLVMALIGVIIASLVNLFLQSSALYWLITYAGVLIFVGLIAYDTQKIKHLSERVGAQDNEIVQKMAILGALTLYLDFINLFLYLLRLLGKRR